MASSSQAHRWQDFGGRASQIANFVDDTIIDGNGHGTRVSGIIGGSTHSAAKQTTLLGVRVLSDTGSGSTSGIIEGMTFVSEDTSTRDCANGVVVKMSTGVSFSAAINSAAAALVSRDKFVAVAAGNENDDGGNYSPASEPSVCTVGGSDRNDNMDGISNYGSAVDMFAPGREVPSTWPEGGMVSSQSCLLRVVPELRTASSKSSRGYRWPLRVSAVWGRIRRR